VTPRTRTPKPPRVPEEDWRFVAGFGRRYSVSSHGRVVSHGRADAWLSGSRQLSWNINNKGYALVGLHLDGKAYKRQVSRLVLEAFVGPCPEGMEAAHLNGTPLDNRVQNLAWVTHTENVRHQEAHGTKSCGERHYLRKDPSRIRRGEHHSQAKLTTEDVIAIRAARRRKVPASILADKYGVSRSYVYHLTRKGDAWAHL
jgi:HNH endonuclease/NUMOD4 motif